MVPTCPCIHTFTPPSPGSLTHVRNFTRTKHIKALCPERKKQDLLESQPWFVRDVSVPNHAGPALEGARRSLHALTKVDFVGLRRRIESAFGTCLAAT